MPGPCRVVGRPPTAPTPGVLPWFWSICFDAEYAWEVRGVLLVRAHVVDVVILVRKVVRVQVGFVHLKH